MKYFGLLLSAFIILTFCQFLIPEKAEPQIDRIFPDVSLSTTGRLVTIEGTNLPEESLIYVGKHLISSNGKTDSKIIKTKIPDNIPYGTYDLRVVSAEERNIPTKKITLLNSETAPIIHNITPRNIEKKLLSRGKDQLITLYGSNFSENVSVFIGGTKKAEVLYSSQTCIQAKLGKTTPIGLFDVNVVNANEEQGSIRLALAIK